MNTYHRLCVFIHYRRPMTTLSQRLCANGQFRNLRLMASFCGNWKLLETVSMMISKPTLQFTMSIFQISCTYFYFRRKLEYEPSMSGINWQIHVVLTARYPSSVIKYDNHKRLVSFWITLSMNANCKLQTANYNAIPSHVRPYRCCRYHYPGCNVAVVSVSFCPVYKGWLIIKY